MATFAYVDFPQDAYASSVISGTWGAQLPGSARKDRSLSQLTGVSRWRRAHLLVRHVIDSWLSHEGARLAASLSFYTLLSMAPLVILTIAVTSVAFGQPAAQKAILAEVSHLIGADGARAVADVISHGRTPATNGWASALGALILLFGASSVFGELQSALNKIWGVSAPAQSGVLALVKSRLFSFAMVLAMGFLSLVSLLASALLTALGTYFDNALPAPAWLLLGANTLVSLLLITALIGVILKFVPDARIRWREVWEGAAVTALLFTIGKSLIGLYLGKAAVGSAYGAAGSLVVLVVWVYYSAMIFYFGAELTRARASGRP